MTKFFLPFFLLLLSCSSSQPDIYEWRGVDRSGVYPDTGLLKEWSEEGPREIWAVDSLGRGYGSPQFTEDRFYITGEVDSIALLYCFDLDGMKLWQTTLGKEWVTSFPGSRSAPTIVGDLIYIGTGMGNLYCVNSADGSLVWSKDFTDDFQGIYPLHGHSEAAVIWGDRVFWTPGGKTHNVVALDRFTGELLWSNPGFGEYSAYNQGKLISLPVRNLFITFSAYHLMGLDAETGELLWSQEQESYPPEKRSPGYGDTHPNSVMYGDGSIYYVAGDGNCGVRLDLSEDGTEITEVWRNPGFDSFMGGVVKIGNFLYTSGTSTQYFKSIDATTGLLTDSLKIGHGAVIAADEMLYYYTQRGQMKLIGYDKGKLKEISSFKIIKGTSHHFSHPVIHNGVLYQRRGEALMAYDISI
ncbi:MAG: PQQ-binding-like beta-propeller repeat protein [Bacteroidales bacterium]|nr:PQQ-binding-like beta-propeller repeat protein [Bacteroidales bacterium]